MKLCVSPACPLPRTPKNLRAVPSPIGAKEVVGTLQSARLDPSILSQHDPHWERLRSRKPLL